MVRLGKKRRDGNSMRPLKIIFEHKTAAKEILDKSPRLSFNRVFDMISIKRDLTLDQRLNRQHHNTRAAESRSNNQRHGNRLPTYNIVNEEHTTRRTVNPNNLVVVANAVNNLVEQNQASVEDNSFYIQHFYNDGDVEENTTTGSGGVGGMAQGNGWGGRVLGVV